MEKTKKLENLVGEQLEAMREDGWEMAAYIPNERLAEEMAQFSVKLAGGQPYTELQLVPSSIWGQAYDFNFRDPGHVVYGKLSLEEKESRDKNPKIIMVQARDTDGSLMPIYYCKPVGQQS